MKFDYLTDNSEKSLAPFFSAKMLVVTFNSIWILGLILIIFWPRRTLFLFVMGHRIPLSFFVVFAVALLVNSYVNLRCGRGEIFQHRLSSRLAMENIVTFEEMRDFFSYGFVAFLLHTLFLLLFLLPLLIVSAAISAVTPVVLIKALSIIFTVSLCCRMFGFLVFLLWGRWRFVGYLTTRTFYIFFIFATGAFAGYVNPALLLHAFYGGQALFAPLSANAYFIYMIVVTFAILLLAMVNQRMVRRKVTVGPLGHKGTNKEQSS